MCAVKVTFVIRIVSWHIDHDVGFAYEEGFSKLTRSTFWPNWDKHTVHYAYSEYEHRPINHATCPKLTQQPTHTLECPHPLIHTHPTPVTTIQTSLSHPHTYSYTPLPPASFTKPHTQNGYLENLNISFPKLSPIHSVHVFELAVSLTEWNLEN